MVVRGGIKRGDIPMLFGDEKRPPFSAGWTEGLFATRQRMG
jgi:hypothetical protein